MSALDITFHWQVPHFLCSRGQKQPFNVRPRLSGVLLPMIISSLYSWQIKFSLIVESGSKQFHDTLSVDECEKKPVKLHSPVIYSCKTSKTDFFLFFGAFPFTSFNYNYLCVLKIFDYFSCNFSPFFCAFLLIMISLSFEFIQAILVAPFGERTGKKDEQEKKGLACRWQLRALKIA